MRPKGQSSAFFPVLARAVLALVCVTNAAGLSEKVIHNFVIYPRGADPIGNLIADAAGNLYGTTQSGGERGYGAIFRLARNPDGKWIETLLHSFDDDPDGVVWAWLPNGGLTFDSSGNLYGTTQVGGDLACGVCGCGTVFKLTPGANGRWNFDVIYRFHGKNDGGFPSGGVVFDAAGNLYGTMNGNTNGAVFQLVRSSKGWSGRTLYSFAARTPYDLAIDTVGNLYGVLLGFGIFQLARDRDGKWIENSLCGGCSATGVPAFDPSGNLYIDANDQVLELVRKQNWKMTVIDEFSGSDGSDATGALTFDKIGNLYGTTQSGGEVRSCGGYGCGTAFKLTHGKNGGWQHSVLYRFKGNRDGKAPYGVIFDRHGNLYGTTLGSDSDPTACDHSPDGCGTVFELATTSDGPWEHTLIYRFGIGDGEGPPSGLVADAFGNLYGTMSQGTAPKGGGDCGMVYELTLSPHAGWKEHILYKFKCGTGDGMAPASNLIFDSGGNLYGTTLAGGSACPGSGCGTVFELSPSSSGAWMERVLYSFTGNADGFWPAGGLIFDTAGNLYGTTEYAHSGQCHNGLGSIGCGAVYQLSPALQGSWNETSLHTFTGATNDGAFPAATLVFDRAGNLYGTTTKGGSGPCVDNSGNSGCGTVFKLSLGRSGAWTENILYNFGIGPTSSYLPNGLTMDSQQNLYGTTEYGGPTSDDCPHYGCGTVYELSPGSGGWSATVLYIFGGSASDGRFPLGALTFDKSGHLYGTTYAGGSGSCYNGCGTVFRLSPFSGGGWKESVFYSFGGPDHDGAVPATGVILDPAGNCFGTTNTGGPDQGEYSNGGTVFEISP